MAAIDALYSELTGSIDLSVNSQIVFTHGLRWHDAPTVPDDVGALGTDSGLADGVTFVMTVKGSVSVTFEVFGPPQTVNFRVWARRNHSIIDTIAPGSSVSYAAAGGASPLSPSSRKARIFYDFGTHPVTFVG